MGWEHTLLSWFCSCIREGRSSGAGTGSLSASSHFSYRASFDLSSTASFCLRSFACHLRPPMIHPYPGCYVHHHCTPHQSTGELLVGPNPQLPLCSPVLSCLSYRNFLFQDPRINNLQHTLLRFIPSCSGEHLAELVDLPACTRSAVSLSGRCPCYTGG